MPENNTNGATGSGFAMFVLTGMVVLGAILLFGMEPLVGRILMPYFGGAAHVWLTSLMFFQAMLLVGYLYAHLLAQRLGGWHLLLLLLPLINLPPGATTRPAPETPLITLLAVLLVNFALPFAVLATTAVVAQSWMARSAVGQRHEPYPLYAASNAGSLLALFGYAFLAEPFLGVKAQSIAWTVGYLTYAILVATAWFILRPGSWPMGAGLEKKSAEFQPDAPKASQYVKWLLLSALPSAFLLTVTEFIAQEVGSFPMVWVLPLALYLGSFVVTFRTNGGVPRFLGALWPELVILGFLSFLAPAVYLGAIVALIAPLPILLALCLVAHGELYRRRPPAAFLTTYYLTMALGGFLGGAAVSLAAPQIFSGLFEYPLILAALGFTFWWCRLPSFLSSFRHWSATLRRIRRIAASIVLGLAIASLIWQIQDFKSCRFSHRNFYGIFRVVDEPPSDSAPAGIRKLSHGKTLHGAQLLAPEQRHTPVSYYYRGGAIADAIETTPSPRRVAAIGLGAGVLSAYAQAGDVLTYYEIDPDNEKIARTWFSYMGDAKTRVTVVPGDGRLSLQEADKGSQYDLIAIDAFTGDGIPTHLLTREAMEVYLSRLARDGIILFHISNRYYDLRGVLKATAAQLNLAGAMNILSWDGLRSYEAPGQCLALARNPERLQPLLARGWLPLGKDDGLEEATPWTDDYINILSPLMANFWPHHAKIDKLGQSVPRADTVK